MTQPILIIDDSPSVRTLMRGALEREHYEVFEASDGQTAIGMLDGRAVGMIVCDISMPRMDGLEFLDWLRQHPRYKFTPLLMLTNESRPEVKQRARQLGAQGFLTKPCKPKQIVSAAQRLCR